MMKKKLLWAGVALVAVSCFGVLLVNFVSYSVRVSRKADMPHAVSQHADTLQEVLPEAQFESDTCGLHSLRVIYRAYGLNPDEENLRERLGLAVPSNPFDGSSTGTVQPDMLRVLVQDNFAYELLAFDNGAATQLEEHLKGGDMAAVLIRRRENGNMHWVVARRMQEADIVVFDSLFDEPYTEEVQAFIEDCVLSCIMVRSRQEGAGSITDAHTDGTLELLKAAGRYQAMNSDD